MPRRKTLVTESPAAMPADDFEAALRRLVATPVPATTHRWASVFDFLSRQQRRGAMAVRSPLLIPLA